MGAAAFEPLRIHADWLYSGTFYNGFRQLKQLSTGPKKNVDKTIKEIISLLEEKGFSNIYLEASSLNGDVIEERDVDEWKKEVNLNRLGLI
jgi:hypothetical protein